MTCVGIDLHSNNMVIVAINDNAELVGEAKLPSSREALEKFFGEFPKPVQAVVECISFWYWLADWCRTHDIPLTLAHSKMVKAISYAKVKTDKVDAKTLAELLRADLIPEAYQTKPERRELRELTRGRLRLIRRRSGRHVARAVVAKELAKGVWHMLTKDESYKGFKGQPVRAASQTCWPQPISPSV